jgi:hypothetical protein
MYCLFSLPIQAQELKVEGYFMQDSAKLGERVAYVLKATYPPNKNIVFADSTYDFSPFVLLEKKSFISSTENGVTLDSAVYYVSNFSLDPLANLAVPVFEIFKYDSLTYYPELASINLQLTIAEIPQEPIFRPNNVYQPIAKDFNYPLMLGILAGIGVLVGVVLFFFGKQIQYHWQVWLEKRRYVRFSQRWRKAQTAFAEQPTMERADELLGLWKGYMEHLNRKPFRDWTTTEISNFLENKEIIKDFRAIELIIYAGKQGEDLPLACANLLNICTQSYQQKITTPDERK